MEPHNLLLETMLNDKIIVTRLGDKRLLQLIHKESLSLQLKTSDLIIWLTAKEEKVEHLLTFDKKLAKYNHL
jgi:predicted nucleic acid-binding protein